MSATGRPRVYAGPGAARTLAAPLRRRAYAGPRAARTQAAPLLRRGRALAAGLLLGAQVAGAAARAAEPSAPVAVEPPSPSAASALAPAAPSAPEPSSAPATPGATLPRVEPRCVVEAALDRPRAFVGEQLHYHVRVLRRPDATHGWETPLAFPRARAEWLVGLAAGGRGPRDGSRRIALSEHRAVFPAHPGPLRIEGASVRCAAADGEEVVPVPAVLAEIEALPSEGRPADFSGLVGPVVWSAVLAPERVALGGSARLSVVAVGSGNTWLAPSPAPQLRAVPALEVFERPAELARDAGRELVWRRYFVFELVPREAGRVALPELRVPHFDPVARVYAETRVPLPALDVRAPPADDAAKALAPPSPSPRAERDPNVRGRVRWVAVAALAAAALLAAAARLRSRARAARRPPAAREAGDWLQEARAADARGDADAFLAAAARALTRSLDGAGPGPWAVRAAALLARVDRARFAPGAERPSLADVEALLAARPR